MLFQGDVSMCALSGLGSEELARTIVDSFEEGAFGMRGG
jgi:hypothetical protein